MQDFLGTKSLVRFPVDCCTSDSRSRSLSTSTAGTLSPQSDNAPLPAMPDLASGLTVYTAGNLVPQSAIVELSLISKTAKFDRIAAYDQVSLRRALSPDVESSCSLRAADALLANSLHVPRPSLEGILWLVRGHQAQGDEGKSSLAFAHFSAKADSSPFRSKRRRLNPPCTSSRSSSRKSRRR